jgi:hypothetical protein
MPLERKSEGKTRTETTHLKVSSAVDDKTSEHSFQEIFNMVDSTSPKVRQSVLTRVVELVKEDVKQNLKPGIAILFAALTAWTDRQAMSLIEKAVSQLISTPTFAAAFLDKLVKFAAPRKSNPNPPLRDSLHCHFIISAFLSSLGSEQVCELAPQVEKLIFSDCDLMEKLQHSPEFYDAVLSRIAYVFVVESIFLPMYVRGVSRNASKYVMAIRALLSQFSKHTTLFAPYKSVFVEMYLNSIFSSSEKQDTQILTCWDVIYKFITHEEFAAVTVAASRLVRRNPEAFCTTLLPFVSGVSMDLSRYVEDWIPSLIEELKAADEARAQVASSVFGQLARKCSQPSVLDALLAGLTEPLKSKTLSAIPTRRLFIVTIGLMTDAKAAGSAPLGKLADTALKALLDSFPAERSELVQNQTILSISKWLCDAEVDAKRGAAAYTFLKTGLTTATAPPSYLDAVLRLHSGFPESKAKSMIDDSKVVAAMKARVQTAVQKPATRLTGVLALDFLLRKHIDNVRAGGALDLKSEAWPALLDASDSFLNSKEFLKKIDQGDAEIHRRLFETVATIYRLSPTPGAPYRGFFTGVVFLLLHSNPSIRRSFLSEAEIQIKKSTALFSFFLQGFYTVLQSEVDISSDVLSHTLKKLAIHTGTCDIPLLALCCHFPTVCPVTRFPSRVWRSVQNSLKTKADLIGAFSGEIEVVKNLILQNGIFAKNEQFQEAGRRCLASIFLLCPDLVNSAVLPQLYFHLQSAQNPVWSKYELAVYNTPEGQVCNFKDDTK